MMREAVAYPTRMPACRPSRLTRAPMRAAAPSSIGQKPGWAEESLVRIMVFANRAIAHTTDPIDLDRFGTHHLHIAS